MDTETQEEHHVIPEVEIVVSLPPAKERQGMPRIAGQQQKTGERYREVCFSAQFNMLSKQRTLNKSGIHSLKVTLKDTFLLKNKKQKTDQHVHRELVWPWHLERESCY